VYSTRSRYGEGLRENLAVDITVVSPTTIQSEFGDDKMGALVHQGLIKQGIEFLPDFPITRIGSNSVSTADGRDLNCNLLMLLPPFRGSSAISYLGVTDNNGYVNVDWTMKVIGAQRMYAVGDCVNFAGPKMGHMAVHQAEVAAANLAAEIAGHEPVSHYDHEVMMVLDARGGESIYFHKDLWTAEPASVRHGRFWSWAKSIGRLLMRNSYPSTSEQLKLRRFSAWEMQ